MCGEEFNSELFNDIVEHFNKEVYYMSVLSKHKCSDNKYGLAKLIGYEIITEKDKESNLSKEVKLATVCSVCGEPQYDTPSGTVCKNGHGGCRGISLEARKELKKLNEGE